MDSLLSALDSEIFLNALISDWYVVFADKQSLGIGKGKEEIAS